MHKLLAILLLALPASLIAQCDDIEVTIVSTTGSYGNEMSWDLYDADYNVIANFQGVNDNSINQIDLCLAAGCYLFQAFDIWGDGWNGGSLEISYDDEVIDYIMPNAAEDYLTLDLYSGDCSFEVVGCTDDAAANYSPNATIDDGSCVYYEDFTINDTSREYIYYEPENIYPGAPLLFAFHGWTGSASAILEYSGLNELADLHGFAVCYPQGLLDYDGYTHWNAGLEVSTVGDLEFILALASFLQVEHDLSADCTFSCGYSNGGFMGYHMACEAAEAFRGIVSVNGAMSADDWLNCDPSSPISIMEIHGTADPEVPYTGMPDIGGGWGPSGSSPDIIDFWVEENECTASETTSFENSTDLDGTETELVKHSGGLEGSEVWFYTVTDGTHDWPGWYGADTDMNTSEEIWKFMEHLCATSNTIEESANPEQLFIYPNPTKGNITIQAPYPHANATRKSVKIYNSSMQLVLSKSALNIDLNKLPAGLYFLEVRLDNLHFTEKLVVE